MCICCGWAAQKKWAMQSVFVSKVKSFVAERMRALILCFSFCSHQKHAWAVVCGGEEGSGNDVTYSSGIENLKVLVEAVCVLISLGHQSQIWSEVNERRELIWHSNEFS